MTSRLLACAVGLFALALSISEANASIFITEWTYSSTDLEWVELTNLGGAAVDMTGWSYSDEAAIPGEVDLSAFGLVSPGESVILAEASEAAFRAAWSLPLSVQVIGDNTVNLGRNDAIYIFDDSDSLVDVLDFGDQEFAGSIRTQNRTGNPISGAALGANDPYLWVLATNGDGYGSYFSSGGDQGNPGINVVVPEPASWILAGVGLAGLAALKRRCK